MQINPFFGLLVETITLKLTLKLNPTLNTFFLLSVNYSLSICCGSTKIMCIDKLTKLSTLRTTQYWQTKSFILFTQDFKLKLQKYRSQLD